MMMKEQSIETSRTSRRSRRHRFSDPSGGILATLAENSPAVNNKGEEKKKKKKRVPPATTLPVKKKEPQPSSVTSRSQSSLPKAVSFSPQQLTSDEQTHKEQEDDDDAISELTSADLGASLRSSASVFSKSTTPSPSSAVSEEDESEDTESEEEDDEEEDVEEEEENTSSEVESTTESSEHEDDDTSLEEEEDDDNAYKVTAWKEKKNIKVGDANEEDDGDSETGFDNDDEYDPDGDETENDELEDEDDSSEELEWDEDDVRITQKAGTTKDESSAMKEGQGLQASDSLAESNPTSHDFEKSSEVEDGGSVPNEEDTEDEHDNGSEKSEMETSSKRESYMNSTGCEGQILDSDDESAVLAQIIDESFESETESVLEVEVDSDEPIEDDTSVAHGNPQPTISSNTHQEPSSANKASEDFGGDSSINQANTDIREKNTFVESSTAIDEKRDMVERELAPMSAISIQVENLSTSPSDNNRDRLAECDEDFIAETLSFKEEGGVESPHLKDGKHATNQQSSKLSFTEDAVPYPVDETGSLVADEEPAVIIETDVVERQSIVSPKLDRAVETASASKESAKIIAQVKQARFANQPKPQPGLDVSRGHVFDRKAEAISGPSHAREALFHRTRSEGSIKQGQWSIGARIGTGSFGVVHIGMNHRTGSLMAVKSIPLQPNIMSDIRREIELLKSLKNINIVRYYGAEINGAGLHIFQEWVAGGSVADLLSKFGPFPFPVIQSYAEQTLKGLAYLHANNVLHRDIKGSNLLVSDEGIIKLADFGGSRKLAELNADMMMSMTFRGTPYFMAPEIFEQRYSSKADIWAVGCVMYEMVTATPPWKTLGINNNPFKLCRHLQNSEGPPPLPRTLPATDGKVLNNFLSVMAQCFHRTPFDRPCSTALLRHAFFTERGYSSDDEWSDTPGLFSPEVIRKQAGHLATPKRALRASPKLVASPVRNHAARTPPRPQNKSAGPVKSPFLSPPLYPRRVNQGANSPKPYTPGKDTSDWPGWAKKKYESDVETNASPTMLDSLVFSTEGSVRPSNDPNSSSGSCLQGLQFLSLTETEASPTPNNDE